MIWGANDVVALNGVNGNIKWRAPNTRRVWAGIAVADLNGDGTLQVIAARDADRLTMYDRLGNTVWTRNPFGGSGELRTLAVADLEHDGVSRSSPGALAFPRFNSTPTSPTAPYGRAGRCATPASPAAGQACGIKTSRSPT